MHSRWTDSYPPDHELAIKLSELSGAPTYTSTYSLVTEKSAEALFESISFIGGEQGWFNSTPLWRLRGMIDRMLQGVGTQRGRRSPTQLRVNDVVDFWRVEQVKKPSRLLLRAEMKLPGRAWLEFRVEPEEEFTAVECSCVLLYEGLRWAAILVCLSSFSSFHFWGSDSWNRKTERGAG